MSEVNFSNESWQWEHDNETACTISVFNFNGVEICRLQSETNAHLIAAAPEMYEFIEMIAKGDGADIQALQYMAVTWVKNAGKLLAKARGE